MNKYYDSDSKRVLFFGQRPDPSFWDAQWKHEKFSDRVRSRAYGNTRMPAVTKRFLPVLYAPRIFEGGCGDGHVVLALRNAGYDARGIDTAHETVSALHAHFPDLSIIEGDVRAIDFPDNYFQGYWSIGVIEHFQEGHDDILDEMARVIAPGGYAFVSFPQMSGFRRWKGRAGRYPPLSQRQNDEVFYQYALRAEDVIADMERRGFSLCMKKYQSRLKGLKDEVFFGKTILSAVSEGRNIFWKVLRKISEYVLPPFFGHSVLLVMKKHDV
ncbi:MAG: class I SAM-dependent methyltransferase [Parcubacteria group bacterium]|nr:class I SAM-dependent methyltransferase [Parcubacteria group bacterium]